MEIEIRINTDNENEEQVLKCLAKSSDMANCLWQLKHNFWRQWKHCEETLSINDLNEKITELFEQHRIDIDDLWE